MDGLLLSWLYRQQELGLERVLGADPCFSVVQPSELVDTAEFVQTGSVILTVGVALPSGGDEVEAYVRRLTAAGAVAIGFGTGLRFNEVPAALVEAVQRVGIALFVVPREVPFTAILSTVEDERARRRMRERQRLLDFQEVLNDIAVQRGMGDLVDTTARHLGAAMLIVDNDRRVVAASDEEDSRATLLRAVDRELDRGGRSSAAQLNGSHVIIHRMNGEGERYHLLAAASPEPFSTEDRSVIKHCAGLADIILQRPESLRRANRELNTLALSLLLGADEGEQVMGSIFSPAADSTGRVRPVVIHADDVQQLQRALTLLDRRLSQLGRHMFVLGLGKTASLVIFRGSRSVPEIRELFGAGANLVRLVSGAPVPWQDLTMRMVKELSDVAVTLQPGGHAGPESRTFRWLGDPAVQGALDMRYKETFMRLVDHDAQLGTDLTRTLVQYLREGSRVAATSQALGVHRHTVRGRIEAIGRICEVDLGDPQVCAELLVLALARGEV
ncbi:PucR family transcriptional regulator [Corynebacterium marinum]|uniref:DNA-binding transcription regulator n=1 Tax=Corynebacterium marinum DSM 44953 TaxID=1224162 RepID=A0A0B6TQ55_9CORY|nr:PucR family transcriptional regulator [Corynebacterium marinum]AJK68339.1 DNA-binding transcription regulator [Corynebacterium marinum DSM 44953]GGO15759.1 hypothetical protein GCM10010980_11530 [Corynebacterium marinum]